jgi:hypothetical protein
VWTRAAKGKAFFRRLEKCIEILAVLLPSPHALLGHEFRKKKSRRLIAYFVGTQSLIVIVTLLISQLSNNRC